MNGIGTTMLGSSRAITPPPLMVTQLFLTVLWVPIVPLGMYVVRETEPATYSFLGKVRFIDFARAVGFRKVLRFYASVALESAAWIVFVVFLLLALDLIARLFGYELFR